MEVSYSGRAELEALLSDIAEAEQDACTPELAKAAIIYLTQVLPTGSSVNPAVFLEAATWTLVGVPMDLVIKLIHPRTGITRKAQWLPGLAELAGFVDAEVDKRKLAKAAALRRIAELDKREALQRDRWLPSPDLQPARQKDTWAALALPKIGGGDG